MPEYLFMYSAPREETENPTFLSFCHFWVMVHASGTYYVLT